MKNNRFSVEQIVGDAEEDRGWRSRRWGDPEGRDQLPDVLLVEGEVCWSGSRLSAPDETVSGGEPAIEAAGGRSDAGQGDAPGRALQKMVTDSVHQ